MYYNKKKLEALRAMYPAGTRIQLHSMEGEPDMPSGLRGRVVWVDDAGQIQTIWDNGRGLAINIHCDSFRKLTPEEIQAETIQTEQAFQNKLSM